METLQSQLKEEDIIRPRKDKVIDNRPFEVKHPVIATTLKVIGAGLGLVGGLAIVGGIGWGIWALAGAVLASFGIVGAGFLAKFIVSFFIFGFLTGLVGAVGSRL